MKVIFNDPATIVLWRDGTKTVVKCQGGDVFDPEKGLAMAIAKKAFGNKGNYYKEFKKWLPEEKEEVSDELVKQGERVFTHCYNCKHGRVPYNQEPCNNCSTSRSKFEHEVKGNKPCRECKYYIVSVDEEPCSICDDTNYPEFEPREGKKTCVNCKYEPYTLSKQPCRSCNGVTHDKFEPKEE